MITISQGLQEDKMFPKVSIKCRNITKDCIGSNNTEKNLVWSGGYFLEKEKLVGAKIKTVRKAMND